MRSDDIMPIFRVGQKVALKTDIKNDGTYPFAPVGALLASKGAVGYIRKIGDFLQTIKVYEVHLMCEGHLVEAVGARDFELELLEDYADEIEEELRWMREYRKSKEEQNSILNKGA